jgi:hypothetical protein
MNTTEMKWKPIVEELLTWMSEDQIIDKLKEKKIEEDLEFDTNFLYMVARDQKKYRLLDYLVDEQDLKRHFLILPKLLEDKRYDLLPVPISVFFQDGIDDLFDSDTVESAREHKLFMDLANKYGTVFVNNLFQISLLNNKSKQSPKLDFISKLDHSQEINPFYEFNKECYLKLLDYYSLERVFKLMLSSSSLGEFIEEDVILLFKEMESLSKEIQSQVLPKKPKNLKKLHDDLSKALISHTKMGISLDQEISYLDGVQLEEFTIEVPKISDDLVSTSIELDHCVHTYIHHVKNGLCCIINLKRADKRVYTVELEKSEGDEFSIVQFKGFQNEESMEGVKGELMRNKILSLIKAQ